MDGKRVANINPDLTSGLDITRATSIPENKNISFLGIQKSGPHDIPGSLARKWIAAPINPNRKKNSEILKPYWNGDDLTGRPRDQWIIDFPLKLSPSEAALYEAPYRFLSTSKYDPGSTTDERSLIEARAKARDQHARDRWWEPYWPRPEMRDLIQKLERYIVTPEVAEHRLFIWLSYPILPDKNLIVIARDDDTTMGILHSRFHEAWALRLGTSLEDRPRYTSSTTFINFPFPEGLTPNIPATKYANDPRAKKIAAAAKRLNELRENWLNPEDLVKREAEVVPGFPDRILPRTEKAAEILKKRTLTNLYNERPAWLVNAHKDLDEAVAAAYGWPLDLSDDEVLARLFALNQSRAGAAKTKGAESAEEDDPPAPKKKAKPAAKKR